MSKVNIKGKEYDVIRKSGDTVSFTISFDSHGTTEVTRINGQWRTDDNTYVPKSLGLSEIGKALEEEFEV